MTSFQVLNKFILTSILVSPALSAIYTNPSQLPRAAFDYIVVGGGAGGNVVGSRLSENPDHHVLILEAGISDKDILAVEAPLLGPTLSPFTLYDWNYTTTSQPGLNGRSVPYAQGRILGDLNAYTRGSADDFNRYAKVSGDPWWTWESLRPYILKSETFVPPVDGHDTTGQYDPAVHGTNGPIRVTVPNEPTPLDQRVLDTLSELPDEFGYQYWRGAWDGMDTLYNRPNLHVLVNAHVTKLLQNGTRNGRPLFGSVQFQPNPASSSTTVHATREIILSAGAFGTPKVLQLSGIGDPAELEPLGIHAIVGLPDVGKNLSHHALLGTAYQTQGPSFDDYYRQPSFVQDDLDEWIESRTGRYSNTVTNHLGFFRLPQNHPILNTVADPSAGPTSSHYEMIPCNLFFVPELQTPATGDYMSVLTVLISPTSRGYTRVSSLDPFAQPLIHPNIIGSEFDLVTLRESVKAVQRFMSASPWHDFVIATSSPLASAVDDATIDEYIRNSADILHHPVGSASMSPREASWGVVDPDLKVKGVEDVRVVDASVMPFGHTMVPVYIIAERAADMIKATAS